MKIILVSGYIGSGKSEFANYLVNYLTEKGCYAKRLAFADKVKEIAKKDFMWDGKKDEKGRRLLQVIGTEAGREYEPDIWVLHLMNTINNLPVKPSVVVIDDWRFPNEYELLSSYYEVYPVRIIGSPSTSDHISEHALDGYEIAYTVIIPNSYTNPEIDFDAPAEHLHNLVCGDYFKTLDNVGE